jgi:hypothetical protein
MKVPRMVVRITWRRQSYLEHNSSNTWMCKELTSVGKERLEEVRPLLLWLLPRILKIECFKGHSKRRIQVVPLKR